MLEVVDPYLKKGSSIYVEGRIRTRKWQDKEGQDRYTTEIEATEMKMLGGRQGGSGGEVEYGSPPPPAPTEVTKVPAKKPPSFDDMDDDIPF